MKSSITFFGHVMPMTLALASHDAEGIINIIGLNSR